MKNKFLYFLFPIAAMSLTSCEAIKKYAEHLNDYVYTMEYRTGFNILQLTDIHWNYNSSTKESKNYLDKVLEEAAKHAGKIDLVELTGDQFMLANSYHVEQFIKYFEFQAEAYGFKYAVIWGNHDHHGMYNPNWLSSQFSKAKHCIHIDPNDDLYGRGNFVINLKEGDNVRWQLFNFDSGASFSETAVSPFKDYDYIRKDQTDWFVRERENMGNPAVPCLAYYHIPQDENGKAWKEVKTNPTTHKNKFFKLEEFADNGNEKYASDFIDVAIKKNLKGAFMGHAHNVDWTVELEDAETHNKMLLGLGVKTGTELYFAHIDVNTTDADMKMGLESIKEAGISENFDLIGASLVTLKDASGAYDLEHLYLNERANGDFVRWVKW